MAHLETDQASRPVLLWIRRAFRLRDNPVVDQALSLASARSAASAAPVIPVYFDDEDTGHWRAGPASIWWLDHSLAAFDSELRRRGSRLLRRAGPAAHELPALAAEVGAAHVVADRRREPALVAGDESLSRELAAVGVEMRLIDANLMFDPAGILTRDGRPFTTFTPYWRACLRTPEPTEEADQPDAIPSPDRWPGDARRPPATAGGGQRGHLSGHDAAWAPQAEDWVPGEAGAQRALAHFVEHGLADYATGRDRPDWVGTSRLSPHLHFGEISPRQVWEQVRAHATAATTESADVFLKELGWREFAHHLLHHFPQTPEQPLRSKFARFPWEDDPEGLSAWQLGATGFPIVDAGMRQMAATGWMHNRVRMIVASFLVKDLLLPWQAGAEWFWRSLVDADLANNTLGWQWAAGCGADAAPYFRVFNPVLQGERYDPAGDYVRHWVPELGRVPDRWVHSPWGASTEVLETAGVRLGVDYPRPIVDHARAREAALAAWRSIRDE